VGVEIGLRSIQRLKRLITEDFKTLQMAAAATSKARVSKEVRNIGTARRPMLKERRLLSVIYCD